MYIESSHIVKYITENAIPREVTVIESRTGKSYVLDVDHTQSLILNELTSDTSIYFSDEKGIVYTTLHGVEHKIQVELPADELSNIKEWLLLKKANSEINSLFRAANAMVEHIKAIFAQEPNFADKVGRLYVLKDIGFHQAGKYHVLFIPDASKGEDELFYSTMKGYVLCLDTGEVKYETVQAWRYQVVRPDNSDPIVQKIWSELSDEWKNILGY